MGNSVQHRSGESVKRTLVSGLAGLMFAAAVLAFCVPSAHAWWDDKWAHRIKVTFNTSSSGANIAETLNDVPVLVRLHAGNFNFANAKADGSDVRFVGPNDKVPLKFHKEFYDPQLEIGLFWVKVPRIAGSANADNIWVYYGNKAVAAGGEDRGGTYDVSRVLVYHFDEKDGAPKDATAYGNNASRFDGGSRTQAVIGNGAVFSGAGERIVVPKSPTLNFSGGMTFSAWVRLSGPQNDAYLFSWEDGERKIVSGIDQAAPYCRVVAGEQTFETPKGFNIPLEGWHHVAFTIKPSEKIEVYVDGSEVSSVPLSVPIPEPSTDMVLGAGPAGDHSFAGELDEVRLSKIALAPGWMREAYTGEGPESSMYALTEEESGEGGGQSTYLNIIFKNLTLDGLIIIGVLIAFGMLSAAVFMRKAILLLLMKKTNGFFLDSFRGTAEVVFPAAGDNEEEEDEEDEFYGSSIYEVYLAGCRELKKWLGRGDVPERAGALSPLGLKAFNAAIERAFVRENQKLNSWMVVLTMAIAGGPFLGLLGTVWGVMNTFAGMAEAGEANLAAIAPGVASALATTVFGLFVAIPSLFAYNYLAQQIKGIATELNLFVDEFLMKVEGNYGGSE